MNTDKNGQICVSKGLLFVLLAVLVVGFAVMVSRTDLLSSFSQAAPRAKKCFYGGQELSRTSTPFRYNVLTKCITDASNVNNGYKCAVDAAGNLSGRSIPDPATCPKPVVTRGCSYAGVNLDDPNNNGAVTGYEVGKDNCIYRFDKTIYLTGYKCVANASGVRVSQKETNPIGLCYVAAAARTACQYGGATLPAKLGAAPNAKTYDTDASGCITADGSLIGLRCDASTKFLGKTDGTCKTAVTKQPVEVLIAACNSSDVKGKVGRVIADYGGPGRNGCQLFNGNYYSTTQVNPIVTAIAAQPLSAYCALEGTVRTGTACGFAVAAPTECFYGGKPMSQWAGTYNVEVGTGCIVTTADGFNTGYYCNPGTFKTTYNLSSCPR